MGAVCVSNLAIVDTLDALLADAARAQDVKQIPYLGEDGIVRFDDQYGRVTAVHG